MSYRAANTSYRRACNEDPRRERKPYEDPIFLSAPQPSSGTSDKLCRNFSLFFFLRIPHTSDCNFSFRRFCRCSATFSQSLSLSSSPPREIRFGRKDTQEMEISDDRGVEISYGGYRKKSDGAKQKFESSPILDDPGKGCFSFVSFMSSPIVLFARQKSSSFRSSRPVASNPFPSTVASDVGSSSHCSRAVL